MNQQPRLARVPGQRLYTNAQGGGSPSRLHDSVADRIAHEIADRAEMQLSHDVRAVGLDRLHADTERQRRLFVTLSFSDELKDLALAGSHGDWREVVAHGGPMSDIAVQHEFGDG